MGTKRKNGSGTVRLRSDGRWEGRIIIGYNDEGKPKFKSVFGKSQTECNKKLKELKQTAIVVSGRLPSQVKSTMKFGEWLDCWYQYYAKSGLRESTQYSYENYIYKHIIPEIGDITLDKLTQHDIQQFYGRVKTSGRKVNVELFGEGLSDRMVRGCHALCRKALEKAVNEKLIFKNPAIGCKIPPKKAREMQVLTHDEMQRFLIQAQYDGYYELFLLELATGLRRGEILGLQKQDLCATTNELHIQRQVLACEGGKTVAKPKTQTSVRTIMIPPALTTVLIEHCNKTESIWMFPSPFDINQPLNPQSVYRKCQQILQRSDCKKIRFHDLRHTFATMALEHGMDIKTLSRIIGHKSSSTTLDIYSHITNEMLNNAAMRIDAHIGRGDAVIEESVIKIPLKEETKTTTPKVEFQPYKGKIRRSGTGGIYRIGENLWEGRYTPTNAQGKRVACNVYAHSLEECEQKLDEMIKIKKAEIEEEKAKLKEGAN